MKKITALILISALLLCSCDDPVDSPEYTTTTPDNSVIGTLTTTSGTTEASTGETTEPSEEAMAELPDNMTFVETGYVANHYILKNYICCKTYKNPDAHLPDTTSVLKFYDIETGKLVSSVTMPEGTEVYAVYEGTGDCLCTASLYKAIEDKGGTSRESSTAVIFTDFTCDIRQEAITELETAVWLGAFSIVKRGNNLVEGQSNGYVLVEGYEEEGDLYGFKTRYPEYSFAMDKNRFVYKITGYECVPGFGFYDFETNTDTFVPDSENLIPMGYHDGKIYSYGAVWDGRPQGIYATDTETLETALITEEPFEMGNRDRIEYHMPDNGEYILIYREWYTDEEYTDGHCAIYKADINTGKILEETAIPSELKIYWCVGYIDDNRILFASDYGEGGFIILDMK